MFSKEIMTCLEQKVILMTQILNLTKEIEVQCNEPEVHLEHMLEKRGELMERTKKCDNLIQVLAEQLPDEQKIRVQQILNQTADYRDSEEQHALELIRQCSDYFERAAVLDRSANEAIKRQYEDTKKHLFELRREGNDGNLYYQL